MKLIISRNNDRITTFNEDEKIDILVNACDDLIINGKNYGSFNNEEEILTEMNALANFLLNPNATAYRVGSYCK